MKFLFEFNAHKSFLRIVSGCWNVHQMFLKPFSLFTSKRKHTILRMKLSQIPIFIAFYHFPFSIPSSSRLILFRHVNAMRREKMKNSFPGCSFMVHYHLACNINCRRFSWILWIGAGFSWFWVSIVCEWQWSEAESREEKCIYCAMIFWNETEKKFDLSVCQSTSFLNFNLSVFYWESLDTSNSPLLAIP